MRSINHTAAGNVRTLRLLRLRQTYHHTLALALIIATAILAVGPLLGLATVRQRPAQEKARRKKLGSSLKRLRWDSTKNAAVEPREKRSSRVVATSDDSPIKLETLLVVFDVTVTDAATSIPVTGLGKDDFVVTEDGSVQQIASVTRGDDASLPRSIVLIVDSSSSQRAYLDASIDAAKELVRRLAPADEMAIVTDDVNLLADFTSDKAHLVRILDSLLKRTRNSAEPGRSLQFTALFAVLREMVRSEGKRPIIIFQTDGDEAPTLRDQDPDGAWREAYDRKFGGIREYGLGDVTRAAERSRATIYTVVPSERLAGLTREEATRRARGMLDRTSDAAVRTPRSGPSERLRELFIDRLVKGQEAALRVAELTGGRAAFLQKPGDASKIYSAILSDINQRYIIAYYPANSERDGRRRSVKIEVRGHAEYTVHGRTSYLAPGGE